MQTEIYQNISRDLKASVGLLELDRESALYRDAIAIGDYLDNPTFKIAVFGPFNYGKSTLLNALLGEKAMPIDLIPTTGAAIAVRYGESLSTTITLTDGRTLCQSGTQILKDYAILNENRRMREDVAAVTVTSPHPLLKTGVEFLDLPGTNDRDAQDALVRDKLLGADLILQVLDGRKLMTLSERENLREWLWERGITTVVFVINFLNLLEPEEQKEVSNRMRFVAKSFRCNLPDGMSNLYRVDALPALRARLKGDTAAAQTSGLAGFESALQQIVAVQREKAAIRFARVQAIATQILQSLQDKKQALQAQIDARETQRHHKTEIQQKAEKLIKQGFSSSSSDFQNWLYLPKLLERYQTDLATALEKGEFITWENQQFKPTVEAYQTQLVEWLDKGCEFFQTPHPGRLEIPFPEAPQVILPQPPASVNKSGGLAPIALATGVGWMVGGPMGAAVVGGASYLLSGSSAKEKANSLNAYQAQVRAAYTAAAKAYLTRFSEAAFASLSPYEKIAETAIRLQITPAPENLSTQQNYLEYLNSLVQNIDAEINALATQFAED
ncbi:dynamin family protein [Phormidium sp. CCY1219]|uniref:dynamin family protein n=1 Tax=Phormidium sp. CCY1219 TaxID=2886104 RepID=UPI002D1F2F1D|nr:dynamin family protein [Phormidium sp. CCY1219]MEB3830837.1 dynamin family protein [Phormidium sp. CCY1219]